jgi:hypothetical protein
MVIYSLLAGDAKDGALVTVLTILAIAVTFRLSRNLVAKVFARAYLYWLLHKKTSDEPEGTVSDLYVYPGTL